MSPAVSVFALALAALLGVAHGSGCATAFIGTTTAYKIDLPTTIIVNGQRDAVIDVPDNCSPAGYTLVGEEATGCDYITAPDITLGPGYTPVKVHRTNNLDDNAFVNIVQYCQPRT